MKAIFSKLLYEMGDRHDTVLVTIVRDKGSAPRTSGAQMLVSKRGRQVGTVGGGGLEFKAEAMALEQLEKGQSLLHDFVLRPNGVEDLGVVCGGDVTLLFQYIPWNDKAWEALAKDVIGKLEAHEQGYLVLPFDGSAASLSQEKQTGDQLYSMELPVGERVFLFGAGHVAMALCPVLTSVGFRVTIVDDRPQYANKENFPTAEAIVVADMNRLSQFITITEKDYLAVMTSGHTYDYVVQQQVLRGPFAYIGVMGSKRKMEVVNQALLKDGVPEDALEKVHSPIGTAIGATTPEELAISIAGEMIQVRSERR